MAISAAPRHAARRAAAHRTGIAQGGWRFPVLAFVAGLAAWLGMCVALYPTVASWFSQYNPSNVVTTYPTAAAEGLNPAAAAEPAV